MSTLAGSTYREIFASANLRRIYDEHIAKSGAIGIDRINRPTFEKVLRSEIALIRRKSANSTYRFSQYREKLVSKGSGRPPRVISIATFRDRITLRALCDFLRARFQDQLNLQIPQVVIHRLKEEIATGKYSSFIKLDVRDFYPSIPHAILRAQVTTRLKSHKAVALLERAIQTPTVSVADKSKAAVAVGVPQGLAISNLLAEIFMHPFDTAVASKANVAYFRYVDDVFLLTSEPPAPLFEELRSTLESDFGLSVHPVGTDGSKSTFGLVTNEFTFLGYLFRVGKARVKEQSVQRLERSLADIFTRYKYRCEEIRRKHHSKAERRKLLEFAKNSLLWRINLRITGCIFEKTRKGWVFYFSQIDESSLEQLRKLDHTVANMLNRFRIRPQTPVRSFVRAYFECHRKNPTATGYIPNFDTASVVEMRRILERYFGYSVPGMSDAAVKANFAFRIRRATKELELDIQDIS